MPFGPEKLGRKSLVGYVVFDEHAVVTELNPAAVEMLGVKHETFLGMPFPMALQASEVPKFLEHLRHCRSSGDTHSTTQLALGTKSRIPVELSTVATIQNGQRRFATTIIDLREHREELRKLWEEKALIEDLFEFVPHPLVALGEELVILATNSAFREKFRTRIADLHGCPLSELESVRWKNEAFILLLRRLIRHSMPLKNFEVECSLSVSGQQLTFVANALRLSPRHTPAPLIILTFDDVTQRRRSEHDRENILNELRDLNATLEQRVRARTSELAGVNGQLKALTQRMIDAQETERRHLARELHDEIGQALTGLNMLLHRASDETNGAARKEIRDARKVVGELLRQVRQMSMDLRPAALDDLGLCVAVRSYIDKFSDRTGIRVELVCKDVAEHGISPETKIAAFRVVQEALTNVARHAKTRSASVTLRADTSKVFLDIVDDGKGFDLQAQPEERGNGLSGMRERVTLAGGQLDLESAPGRGTRVLVQLPLTSRGGPK